MILQGVARSRQQILIVQIRGAVEELAQNFVFLVAVSLEKFPELPLRQHDDLAELFGAQTQQLFYPCRHFLCPGERLMSGFPQRCVWIGLAVLILRSAFFDKVQTALHLVLFFALPKTQHDPGVHGFGDMVAVEHVCAAVGAAGHAVEGEHDRVEDRGLSRARVPGHQIQAVFEPVKGDFCLFGIGAEGGHFKIYRSHVLTSCPVR